jgi:hypothetical protein
MPRNYASFSLKYSPSTALTPRKFLLSELL